MHFRYFSQFSKIYFISLAIFLIAAGCNTSGFMGGCEYGFNQNSGACLTLEEFQEQDPIITQVPSDEVCPEVEQCTDQVIEYVYVEVPVECTDPPADPDPPAEDPTTCNHDIFNQVPGKLAGLSLDGMVRVSLSQVLDTTFFQQLQGEANFSSGLSELDSTVSLLNLSKDNIINFVMIHTQPDSNGESGHAGVLEISQTFSDEFFNTLSTIFFDGISDDGRLEPPIPLPGEVLIADEPSYLSSQIFAVTLIAYDDYLTESAKGVPLDLIKSYHSVDLLVTRTHLFFMENSYRDSFVDLLSGRAESIQSDAVFNLYKNNVSGCDLFDGFAVPSTSGPYIVFHAGKLEGYSDEWLYGAGKVFMDTLGTAAGEIEIKINSAILAGLVGNLSSSGSQPSTQPSEPAGGQPPVDSTSGQQTK